jgi:hypothetical protein
LALQKLEVDALVTIGGDDTAFSASRLAEVAGGSLRVAHVPKIIDNDLMTDATTDSTRSQRPQSSLLRHSATGMVTWLVSTARLTNHSRPGTPGNVAIDRLYRYRQVL